MADSRQHIRVQILGCGSSGGVPRVGNDWGACDPDNPKNYRTRCSILIDAWHGQANLPPAKERTTILIDTSPDLRAQLLSADVKRLDAVFFTHDHADQTHGMDDLRALAYRMRSRIPTFINIEQHTVLIDRFKYIFELPEGRIHPPILDLQPSLIPGKPVEIAGPGGSIELLPLALSHGAGPSTGFKFGGIVYTPDVWDIDDTTAGHITGASLWIIDALRYADSPSHFHMDKTLEWLSRAQVKHSILTNLHVDLDYDTLRQELPNQNCKVAYDGMVVQMGAGIVTYI